MEPEPLTSTKSFPRLSWPILAGLGVWLAVVAMHTLVWGGWVSGDSALGRLVERSFGLALVAAMISLGTCSGDAVLRRFRSPRLQTPLSRWLFALTVGCYLIYLGLFVLGLFAAINAIGVLTLAGLLLALGWKGRCCAEQQSVGPFDSESDTATTDETRTRARQRWGVGNWLIVVALMLWVLPYLMHAVLPSVDHDSLVYHLPFAQLLTEQGVWVASPEMVQNNYPAANHLWFAMFMALGGEAAVVPLNLTFAMLILVALYALSCEVWNKQAALLAALSCLSVSVIWGVGITARVDSTLGFFGLMCVFGFLVWRKDPRGHSMLIVMACALAVTLGIKYSALFLLLVLVPLILVMGILDAQRRGIPFTKILVLCVAIVCIPSAFWYGRNFLLYGDPVYPRLAGQLYGADDGSLRSVQDDLRGFFTDLEDEETRDLKLSDTGFAFHSRDEITVTSQSSGNLFNLWDTLRNPARYARQPRHMAGPFVLLFFLLPLVSRDESSWWVFAIGIALWVLIAWQASLMRYLLPVLPIFALGAGRLVQKADAVLMQKAGAKVPWLSWLFSSLIALMVATYAFQEVSVLQARQPMQYLLGKQDRDEWTATLRARENDPFWRASQWINQQIRHQQIASDASLFMIGEGRGFLLNCDYHQDLSWSARPWMVELMKADGDPAMAAKNLNRRGYDYLLVNIHFLDFWAWYSSNDAIRHRLALAMVPLHDLLKNHTEIIYDADGIIVARLKSPIDANLADE